MKAIKTEYFPPTNNRGARIKASDGDGNSIIYSWAYENDIEENHLQAMKKLCIKMSWDFCNQKGWYKNAYYWTFNN